MKPNRQNAPKGMHDVMPPDIYIWQAIERTAREVFGTFGYQEIRPPVLEMTSVFSRGIGETSDIVEKEMYTFEDKGGRSVTLRPEGTASVVRAYVQNNMHTLPQPQKLYYTGPMFRYERPQKGRQRQFYQIGAEAFGASTPTIDAEVISMLGRFLTEIGLTGLSFQINSIGCPKCRPDFRDALKDFFRDKMDGSCPDCARRFEANPLRIIDCKVPRCVELRQGAPSVLDHLCGECEEHFSGLKSALDMLGVEYAVNPLMVRGLDYYTRTTFEVTSDNLGAQNAVAAGGRYDRLVEEFGGKPTPAIGFAVGMERLVALLGQGAGNIPVPDVYVASIGAKAASLALGLCDQLRQQGAWVELSYTDASLKSQMKRADRIGARLVLIIGDDELASGQARWRIMNNSTGGDISLDDARDFTKLKSL